MIQRAVQLAMVVLTLAAGAHGDGILPSQGIARPTPQTYLFPIMKNGLNNQKRDLRNYLALAKELGVGIILPGFFGHHTERRPRPGLGAPVPAHAPSSLPECFPRTLARWRYLEFERSIDRAPIANWVPTVTVKELKALDWDGQIDAVMYPIRNKRPEREYSSRYLDRALLYEDVVVRQGADHIVVPEYIECKPGILRSMRTAIRPYRVVGVVQVSLGQRITVDMDQELQREAPNSTCTQTLFEANRLLRPAPWIALAAHRYAQQVMGHRPYMAVHIRPFPDPCLYEWKAAGTDFSFVNSKVCTPKHHDLHRRIGKCLASAMQRTRLRRVFVMTHPSLVEGVRSELSKAGIDSVTFLDDDLLTAITGCNDHTATFLSMVEEAVSVQSDAFVGTTWSSITHSIVFTRLGQAASPQAHNNLYWETMQCS